MTRNQHDGQSDRQGPLSFLRHGFARSVATVTSGTIARHAILFLSAPVLSRLYSPNDFGTLALLTALLGFVQPISGLRYELAIPIARKERHAEALMWMSTGLTVAFAIFIGVGTFIAREPLSDALNAPDLASVVWTLPILVATAGTYEALSYLAVRRRAYGTIAATRLTQGVGNAGVGIGLGVMHLAPLGLVLGDVVGRGGGVTRLAVWARRSSEAGARPPDRRMIKRLASRYKRFPLYSVWVGLASSAAMQVLPLFLSGFYDAAVAGLYLLAARVVEQPLKVLGTSVSQVYLGEAAEGIRRSPATVRDLFGRVLRNLTLLAAVPFTILIVLGPPIFEFIFGQEWRTAGQFAQAAAPMFAAQFVTSPLSQTLTLLERQDVQLWFGLTRLGAIGLVFASVTVLDLSAWSTVFGYSIVNTIAYVVLALLSLRHLEMRDGDPSSEV